MRRVTEADLGTIQLKNVEGAELVRPGELTGVSVDVPHKAAHVARPGESGPATLSELLLIEVEDPQDASTMARVRAALGLDEGARH